MVATSMRAFDVAVLGATGFTGRLACEYLAAKYPTDVRWLVAGRSPSKLADIEVALGIDSSRIRIVDCTDEQAVESLVKECSVVANFAGTPFIDKALPVVDACIRHGTHVCTCRRRMPTAQYLHIGAPRTRLVRARAGLIDCCHLLCAVRSTWISQARLRSRARRTIATTAQRSRRALLSCTRAVMTACRRTSARCSRCRRCVRAPAWAP